MNLFEILFLSVALGMDCLVVSFSQGLIVKTGKLKSALSLALAMGFFQWLMPYFGYFGANTVISYIEPFSKWITFTIFLILGAKFIIEAFEEKKEEEICIDLKCLIGLGIATSIDALASGIGIKLSNTPLLFSTAMIGLASFLLSLTGFNLALFFKKIPSKILEISGGIILIGLSIKALL